MTHDRAQAEDLLQETVANLLERGKIDSVAYLVRSIRNRFVDLHRRGAVIQLTTLGKEPASGAAGAERLLPLHDEIGRALASLPPADREVLYLNAVEGFSATEIADLVGRPRNTVLTMLARARNHLKSWRASQRRMEVL